jgi:hypothetical protein
MPVQEHMNYYCTGSSIGHLIMSLKQEEAESQESARGGEATGSAMETPSTKKKTKAKGRGVQGGVGHARPSHPLYVSL